MPIALRVCCLLLLSAPLLSHAQVEQSWVRSYRGTGAYQHLWAGPALGTNGEVCLTGTLTDPLGESHFTTVKYDSGGNEVWVALYNGATNQSDVPSKIKVLPDGHVIVTGRSGPYEATDFATVKYSPAGSEVWARRHAAALDPDQPTVLAIDRDGNICVAGATLGGGAVDSDIVTIKYSSGGALDWVTNFAGLSRENDLVADIATDTGGNIYITGRSQTGADWDYYVVKYAPNGAQLWVARYDGPLRQFDSPTALLVDAAGFIYVTGYSLGEGGHEIATVQYNSAGTQVWAARYALPGADNSEARAMSFDSAGNLLLLANSYGPGEQEWLLVKYDSDGNRLWTARYNGALDRFDAGYGLAVDAAGHPYITGVSDHGNGWHFVTVKYDERGNRRWAAHLTPDGMFDYPVGIVTSLNGNLYVAGQSRYFEGPGGFLTVKYAQTNGPADAPAILVPPASQMVPGDTNVTFSVVATGAEPLAYQWRYNGRVLGAATNSSLMLSNLTLEQSGHYSVEVTNDFGSSATPEADLLVLIPPMITEHPTDQFTFAGAEATFSVAAYGTPPFQYQWLYNGVAVLGDTRILNVTNVQVAHAGNYQAVVSNQSGAVTSGVARLTVSRQVQQDWVAVYDGPGHGHDVNPLVKLDGAGNIYVAGTSLGASDDTDFAIIKYNAAGARLWTARYVPPSDGAEVVAAMEVDAAGNVWLTGWTTLSTVVRDALTVKYSSAGGLLWAAQFGSADLFEAGFAIAIDGAGNAYVTGQTGQDFLTIKYDSAGNQIWAADFNGAGNATDTARSIAVAGANVYVTGLSWNGSNLDFLTLKYDTQGNLSWNTVYDAAGADTAVALAVDSAGNVIVAGNSYGTINYDEFGSDYVIVKYDAGGNRLWSARYDGFMNAEDYPTALAVDSADNIYVTGHSDFESHDSGVRQFATLKYDPAGRELWRSWHIGRQYDGSRSLEVDSAGNVYITSLGTGPFSGRDIAFIKYDALGNQVLTARFNGADNSDDTPSTLALDAQGNLYIAGVSSGISDTGLDFVLVKYRQNAVAGLPAITAVPQSTVVGYGSNALFSATASGEQPLSYQWLFNGREIEGATNTTLFIANAQFEQSGSYSVRVVNIHGRVFSPAALLDVQAAPSILSQPQTQTAVIGSTVLLSVNALGSSPLFYRWFVNGVSLSNATSRMLTLPNVQPTAAGVYDVLITNRVGSLRSASARLVVTPRAQQCWVTNYNGPPGNATDNARTMALGTDGCLYVTGYSVDATTGADYATVKYDTNGNQLWVVRYNGPENGHDFPTDLAVDADGHVYVTGVSWGGGTGLDIATVKYDSAGNEIWVARFNSPDNLEDTGRAVAVDSNGNVLVAGLSVAAPYNPDFVTIKYSSSGTQLWAIRYDGPGRGYDDPADIAVDSAGRVYVTGTSTLSGQNTDLTTIKYDVDGTQVWAMRYNGPANARDTAARLRLDESGNVYAGGSSDGVNGFPDYAVVKYSPVGAQLWAARYDGLRQRFDYLSDLVVDTTGNVYVTGTADNVDAGYATIKLNANGERLWLATWSRTASDSEAPAALALDSSGHLYLAGTVYTGESFDAATLCYDTNGNRLWTATYGGPTNVTDYSVAIAADAIGQVFVTGTSTASDQSDFFTLKYVNRAVDGAPIITVPPQSRQAVVGEDVTFSASATGDAPLAYRWFFGNSLIAEGNSLSNAVVQNVTDAAGGHYAVEVLNDLGSAVSPVAELRVNGPSIPRFSHVGLTNGYVHVVVLGESGFTYRLDASLDLRNWSVVATNYSNSSSIEFIEPFTDARRYYRAVKLP